MLDEPNFVPESVVVRQISDSTFEMDVTPVATLSAGVYTGALTLKLCKDPQCAAAYSLSGGSLPYELTVEATLAVTIKINGKTLFEGSDPVTAYSDMYLPVVIASGDRVELNSGAEVDWLTNITAVRLKVEQIQLLSAVGWIRLGEIGLQGA